MACLLFLNYDLRYGSSEGAPKAFKTAGSVLKFDDLKL